MSEFKKGDLVYIPSHVTMRKYLEEKDRNQPISMFVTAQPTNLLIMEETDKHGQIGVHYHGEVWFLNEKSAYLSRETK